MATSQYAAYEGAEPYFQLVRSALGERVDGEHFFDIVADNIVYEVLYDLGWPRAIEGREALMAAFKGYVNGMLLHSADKLVTHATADGCVIEYEVHGTVRSTGIQYDNRFCSIIKIADRKIVHWRDYMDSHAAWSALTAQ